MTSYAEFAEKFLIALYQETERTGRPYHTAGEMLKKYDIQYKPLWISQVADEWEHLYFKNVSRIMNGYEHWAFWISAQGVRQIESKYGDKDGVPEVLTPIPDVLSDGGEAEVPAADRIVRLDHNSAPFKDIADGFDDVHEAVRSANTVSEPARSRVLCALEAAKILWGAAELRGIQIKVGILLAFEDAADALQNTAKAVAIGVLIDTLKAFVKARTGIDLDRI